MSGLKPGPISETSALSLNVGLSPDLFQIQVPCRWMSGLSPDLSQEQVPCRWMSGLSPDLAQRQVPGAPVGESLQRSGDEVECWLQGGVLARRSSL